MESGVQAQLTSSDEEIALHFKKTGDNELFSQLFAKHKRKVFFVCRSFFDDRNAAEDATQETFLRAYVNIAQFHGGDFSRWIMRIAKNACIDEWRKRRPVSEFDETTMAGGSTADTFASSFDLCLTVEKVLKEMRLLPPEQQLCLELKIEGYSYEETAVRTGFTVDAVKSHLQNGRRMLWMKVGEAVSQLR
jgi:RNA polymerase sigma-70 factor (ECF subfamily)